MLKIQLKFDFEQKPKTAKEMKLSTCLKLGLSYSYREVSQSRNQ